MYFSKSLNTSLLKKKNMNKISDVEKVLMECDIEIAAEKELLP